VKLNALNFEEASPESQKTNFTVETNEGEEARI
jgi:hypothetical protein